MYEKVGQEFPGEKITSSGTTGEGGKLRKSLNQKGIVAKAMDYGQVRNVLASLMPDVRGDLPVPELKVVNNIKSRWLGDCRWTIGSPTPSSPSRNLFAGTMKPFGASSPMSLPTTRRCSSTGRESSTRA